MVTSEEWVERARKGISDKFPDEYAAGVRDGVACGLDYPPGFIQWTVERRDAYFAGYNFGRCERLESEKKKEKEDTFPPF